MKNITRLTLATAAALTILASTASAAGYIKFDGIDGEFKAQQLILENEEVRFLEESETRDSSDRVNPEVEDFCDPYHRDFDSGSEAAESGETDLDHNDRIVIGSTH